MILALLKYFRSFDIKSRIRSLADDSNEVDARAFLSSINHRIGSIYGSANAGVYILCNKKNRLHPKYYVGQSHDVFSRVNQHFTGKGNGDVYADWKRGDPFTVKIILLRNSPYDTLNTLERVMIFAYNAYYNGYNKTRGNKGVKKVPGKQQKYCFPAHL